MRTSAAGFETETCDNDHYMNIRSKYREGANSEFYVIMSQTKAASEVC